METVDQEKCIIKVTPEKNGYGGLFCAMEFSGQFHSFINECVELFLCTRHPLFLGDLSALIRLRCFSHVTSAPEGREERERERGQMSI